MNNNITQEEKTAYDTFLNKLKDLLITSGEVTSSEIGDILSMSHSEYQRLGSFFKKLGFAGVIPTIKESLNEGSASPLYKYVLGTAIAFITIPPATPLWLAIGGTYFIGVIAENLWDLSIDFGEWLAENQGKEIDAIKNILENKNIIITSSASLYPFTFFQDQYNPLYNYDDLIEILKDKTETAEETRSPLAIDLDGDGVETVSVDNGVYFDHDGNGFAEKTGWIGKDDGILVRDLNNNGQIDDGSELFGDQTILSNGEKAANGFEALADLDSNHDGVFDGDDEAFGEIKVWQDLNQNGVVDDGELKTLNEAGITSINLNYQNQTITDNNGNEHNQTGSFTKTDATTGTITDVWFDVDYADTIDLANVEISDEIAELPNVDGFGNVHDLHTAMALDTTGTLKTLVEQYIAATDFDTRDAILLNLIYT